ncbi:hypothetical protein FHG87_008564, partial [Trinorchestia longiramus]
MVTASLHGSPNVNKCGAVTHEASVVNCLALLWELIPLAVAACAGGGLPLHIMAYNEPAADSQKEASKMLCSVGPSLPQLCSVGPYLPQLCSVGPYLPQLCSVGLYLPQLCSVGLYLPQLCSVGACFFVAHLSTTSRLYIRQ